MLTVYLTVAVNKTETKLCKNQTERPISFPIPALIWRPHGDSNPGTHRERVMS